MEQVEIIEKAIKCKKKIEIGDAIQTLIMTMNITEEQPKLQNLNEKEKKLLTYYTNTILVSLSATYLANTLNDEEKEKLAKELKADLYNAKLIIDNENCEA